MRWLTPAQESDLNITACPACHRDLRVLPRQASFCPGCRRRIRPRRTVWRAAWALLVRMFRGRADAAVDRSGPRAPVVVGYSNALWRLGWRYEHGRGVMRNVPEAMRCYSKSAGLGNAEAAARVEAAAAPVPVEVIPV